MPTVMLRPFAPDDLASVVGLWNGCLQKDLMTEERFWRLFLLDANFDREGMLVAEVDGQPVGFLQTICRRLPVGSLGLQPHQGWITAFFVHPDRRRQGIGTHLLEAGLAFLTGRGRTEVLCNGYSPYYVFPGVDLDYPEALAFLESRGFQIVSNPVAMGMPLEGVRMPSAVRDRSEALCREGYEVRLFRRADTLPLLDFAERHFPHWQPSVLDGLQHGNEEITLATQDGEIVAFAQWENTYTDPPRGVAGRFGPFGVREDLRGNGIGAVVFYSLIERVRGDGARYLWFGWAGGRNLSFYQRAGCVITRQYRLFRRDLV